MLGLGNQHYWAHEQKVAGTKDEQSDRDKKEK